MRPPILQKDLAHHPRKQPDIEPTDRVVGALQSIRRPGARGGVTGRLGEIRALALGIDRCRLTPAEKMKASRSFGAVAKWLGNGLQNRHTSVRIRSAPLSWFDLIS